MPLIEAPPVQPAITTDLELFARAYFNIRLTRMQIQLIKDLAAGKEIRLHRRMGLSTANKVFRAYVQAGLDPNGRNRLPQHSLPVRYKPKSATQHGRVLEMIRRPGGAYNFELSRIALKYTSVISDLRQDGYVIIAERQFLKNGRASNTFRYTLAGEPKK